MTSSCLIFPSPSTGNNRRIELAGFDLWTTACIDNIFVYPSTINIDQFTEALSRTLSSWPLISGRIRLEDGEHYMIEMSDNGIPVTLVNNHDLNKWPLDSNVIVEIIDNPLQPFLDPIHAANIFGNSQDEPLVRIKLTHLVQSGEWVFGVSWAHLLGDAAAFLHFLNALSCFYQQMEPLVPSPVFERRLWRADEADQSFLSIVKQQRDAKPTAEIIRLFLGDQIIYDPLVLRFSGAQLTKLRTKYFLRFSGAQLTKLRILAGGDNVTIQDALTAYIILTLNTYCYFDNDERRILRTNTAVHYRGVSDAIASKGQISNAVLMMLSDHFDHPYSLSNIATVIRRSMNKSRDAKFLETWIATADGVMRNNIKYDKLIDMGVYPNELLVNSNLKYDWANLVDFGYTDKCRFYTPWIGALCVRTFRLNPEKNGNEWLARDHDGAEISFRMEKDLKAKFVCACKRDIGDNFENVKT